MCFFCCVSQACRVAARTGPAYAEAPNVREGVARDRCSAVKGLDPLHDPYARATHPAVSSFENRNIILSPYSSYSRNYLIAYTHIYIYICSINLYPPPQTPILPNLTHLSLKGALCQIYIYSSLCNCHLVFLFVGSG